MTAREQGMNVVIDIAGRSGRRWKLSRFFGVLTITNEITKANSDYTCEAYSPWSKF
jgi:hypothetical protein